MKKLYSIIGIAACAFVNAQVYDIGSYTQPTDISNNGIAVGNAFGVLHFMWTAENGPKSIGESISDYISGNTSISADGTVISGSMNNPDNGEAEEMALYNPATEQWTFLGGLGQMFDNGLSSAWGLSSDGKTVVGLAWANGGTAHAIKWTEATGIVDLGSTVPGRSSRANAVSADGSVVVGWQDSNSGARRGVYWIDGVQKAILDSQGNPVGEAMAVSANGKTIVGSSDPEGYIWNVDTGYTKLEHSDSDYVGSVTALSDDGNVAIGYFRPWYDNNLAGEGFIWFKDRGLVKLDDYIEELGYDSLSFTFVLPTAISPDGKYIGGIGLNWDEEDVKGFVVKLPNSTMATTEVAKTAGLAVYPNPVADILNVATTGKLSTVEVFNASGQKVWSQNNDTKQIDLSHLAKGVYLLTATVDGKKQNIKFIKK